MKTHILSDENTVILKLIGKIDCHSYSLLKEEIIPIIDKKKKESQKKIVLINCAELDFVGSSGISPFIQSLKELNTAALPLQTYYCHLKSELKKMIQSFDQESFFSFHETEENARHFFSHHFSSVKTKEKEKELFEKYTIV